MAAPTIVSGHTTAQDSTAQTSRTISVPTHSSGDRVIIAITASISSPTLGVNTFTDVLYQAAISSTAYVYIASKTAGGSEGSTYTITSASCVMSAVCFAVNGAGGTSHVLPTTATGSSATATGPAITTYLNDTLRICVLATDDSPGVTSVATMTGHTLIATQTGSSKPTVSVQYKTLASAGTDAAQTSALSGSEQWTGVTFAMATVAEVHVTKAAIYAELGGAIAAITKAGIYVESILAQIRATLAGVYVEIIEPQDTNRVTNYGAYVQLSADLPDGDPSGLTATPVSSSQINLAWTDNSTNETGFYVERSLNQSVWNLIATVASPTTTYNDTGRNECTTYYYRVRAYNADGNSGYSNTASALTLPDAPTIGTVSAGSPADIAVNVTWTDNSAGETSQVIQHTTTPGSGHVTGATVAANATSGTDSSLSPSTTYYFRVGACNASGCSYSAESSSIATGAAPQDVYDLQAQLYVDWDHNGTFTDETAYLIEARGTHRLAPPGQSITATNGQVSQCTVIVDNSTQRFSSHYSPGALYSYIQSGKMYHVPVRINISTVFGGTSFVRVFTGVARIPTELTLTTKQARTLAIDCRGIEETLLNKRLRTTRSAFAAAYDALQTESDHFDDALTAAGLTVTTDYVLDTGLHTIPFFWLDNESVIEALWQASAICGGRFYGRKDGILAYENATHWLLSPHNTSQATYSRDGSGSTIPFGSLELTWDETELAEETTVTYTPRVLGEDGTLWESETIVVPAGVTSIVWGTFENPVYSIASLTSTAGSPGGGDLSGSVTITPTYYASSVKLSIANAASVDAYVNIQIAGQPTASSDSTQIVRTSADGYWTSIGGRTRSIGGNKHLQNYAQASMIANFLGERQETPSLVVRLRGCPGDPNRTIGDRITIADAELSLNDTYFYITAVSWRYSSRGYVQDFDCIRCADLYPYFGNYFVIGTDYLGAGNRVYY